MVDKRRQIITQIIKKIKLEESDSFNYLLPQFLAKILVNYMSMREDLLLIQRQTEALLKYDYISINVIDKTTKDCIIQALWYSIVVTYARCFTDASKSSNSKLEIKDCFTNNEFDYLKTHSYLMDLRNNFVAHRGDSDNEISVVFMKIPKDDSKYERTEYRIKSVRSIMPSTEILKNCLDLFQHLQKVVETKLQKQTQKVHKKFLHGFEPTKMLTFLIK